MTVVNPKSISGINSITTGSGSDNLLTIHTSDASNTERLRINSSGDVIVGSGITVSPDGDIFATGVTTSTTFSGNFSGGTVSGTTGTFTGDVDIADKIVHTGDTDTAIRFPAADTITAETGGSERIRITSTGLFGIGITPTARLHVNGVSTADIITARAADSNGNSIINILSEGTTGSSRINFSDTAGIDGQINYSHNTRALTFAAGGTTEQLRIDSSGRVLIGTTDVGGGNADDLTIATSGNTGITIRSGTSNTGNIFWSDATSGADQYIGALEYHHSDNQFKFNISNTTRMTVDSTGDVTISDGDLVIGTSGHGIDFSNASPSASNPSHNILDDYEEGTWTLGVAHDGITEEYGRYTKIGRMVFATFEITFGSSSNGNHQYITGLPFTSQASSDAGGNCGGVARDYQNYDIENGPIYHIQQNNTIIYLYKNNGATMNANNTSGYNFRGTAVYHAA